MERSLTVDLPVDQVAKVVRRHLVIQQSPPSPVVTASQIPPRRSATTPLNNSPYPSSSNNNTSSSNQALLRSNSSGSSGSSSSSSSSKENVPLFCTHHQLPGGAIVDEIYKWTARVENLQRRRRNSVSFPAIRQVVSDPSLQRLKQPGGFRRHYALSRAVKQGKAPNFITSSFVEFLYLYGHFGGEDLSDDEEDTSSSNESSSSGKEEEDELLSDDDRAHNLQDVNAYRGRLLIQASYDKRHSHHHHYGSSSVEAETAVPSSSAPVRPIPDAQQQRRPSYYQKAKILQYPLHNRETMPLLPKARPSQGSLGKATPGKAMFLLLKSFVTTGIMFLPKAFRNGGLLFSAMGITLWALISLWSFLLLVQTRLKVHVSFGEMGGVLYGPKMKMAVLVAITLSQIGFVCAYMVFVAENLQALVLAFSKCRVLLPMHLLILAQSFAFIPLAMIRKIQRLSVFALIADIFIVIGLAYLFYYDIKQLVVTGVNHVIMWNPLHFPLFIGTVAFTYEGIGLVIPITESMQEPQKFPGVLRRALIVITGLFISLGAISYLAFGDDVQTIILLNLPSKDPVVSSIQALYSLAICLSIPLQLFPAIRIMENGLFTTRSGKNNTVVKWQKNVFRVLVVFLCAWIAIVGSKDKLDKFVSLIGASFCIPLCFVFPPLFHMKAIPSLPRWRHAADIALITFGIVCMIFVIGMTVTQWNSGDMLDPVKQCVAHQT